MLYRKRLTACVFSRAAKRSPVPKARKPTTPKGKGKAAVKEIPAKKSSAKKAPAKESDWIKELRRTQPEIFELYLASKRSKEKQREAQAEKPSSSRTRASANKPTHTTHTSTAAKSSSSRRPPAKTKKRTPSKKVQKETAKRNRRRELETSVNWGAASSSDEAPASEGRRSRRLKHVPHNYAASSEEESPRKAATKPKSSTKKAAEDSDEYKAETESESEIDSDNAYTKADIDTSGGRRSRRLRKVGKVDYTAPPPIIPTLIESPSPEAVVEVAPEPKPKRAAKNKPPTPQKPAPITSSRQPVTKATPPRKALPKKTAVRKPVPKKKSPKKAAPKKTAPTKPKPKPSPVKAAVPKKTWSKKRPSAAVTATAEPSPKKARTRRRNPLTPGKPSDPEVLLLEALAYHDAVLNGHTSENNLSTGQHLWQKSAQNLSARQGSTQGTGNVAQSGPTVTSGELDSNAMQVDSVSVTGDKNGTSASAAEAQKLSGDAVVGVPDSSVAGKETSVPKDSTTVSSSVPKDSTTVSKDSSAPMEYTGLGLETDEVLDDEVVGELSETEDRESREHSREPVPKDSGAGAGADQEKGPENGGLAVSERIGSLNGMVDYDSDEDDSEDDKNTAAGEGKSGSGKPAIDTTTSATVDKASDNAKGTDQGKVTGVSDTATNTTLEKKSSPAQSVPAGSSLAMSGGHTAVAKGTVTKTSEKSVDPVGGTSDSAAAGKATVVEAKEPETSKAIPTAAITQTADTVPTVKPGTSNGAIDTPKESVDTTGAGGGSGVSPQASQDGSVGKADAEGVAKVPDVTKATQSSALPGSSEVAASVGVNGTASSANGVQTTTEKVGSTDENHTDESFLEG